MIDISKLDLLNFSRPEMVTFMREMDQCSIFPLYEILNLSTKKVGSIYYNYVLFIIQQKKLNKIFLAQGKKFFRLNQIVRIKDNEKEKSNRF